MPEEIGTRPRPGQPGQKPPMKKTTRNWLIIGAVGAAGILIWYVMKNRSQQSQAGQTAQDMAAQGIDPNTGIPYSQEMGGGFAGGTPSLYGYTDPTTGAFISGVGANPVGSGGVVLAPATNAAWAQQVEAYLQTLGYDPVATAAAIGKYLTGQTLTADQAAIVAAAKGFFGNPPQNVPNPPTTPPPGQSGGGTTPGHHHRHHRRHHPNPPPKDRKRGGGGTGPPTRRGVRPGQPMPMSNTNAIFANPGLINPNLMPPFAA